MMFSGRVIKPGMNGCPRNSTATMKCNARPTANRLTPNFRPSHMNRPPPIIAADAMISEARTKRIDPARKLAMNLVKGSRSEGREASGNRYNTITKVKIKDVKMAQLRLAQAPFAISALFHR